MVLLRGNLAVQQHLRILRHVGSLGILRSQQRLPSLLRQISLLHAAAAVAGIRASQVVHLLVAGVARVPFDPHELHRAGAARQLGVDRPDERRVLHRLLLRVLPAVLLPPVHPLGGTVDGVLRVGLDDQRLRAGMCAQRLQHCAQFADLIRAVRGAAGIAVAAVLMAAGMCHVEFVVGPGPAHWAVRIAQGASVCRYGDGHDNNSNARRVTAMNRRWAATRPKTSRYFVNYIY